MPRKRDRRKNSRHQDDGDQAGQNQKQKIVAGVQRGERHDNDSADVDPAFARDAVLHFVADPAKRRALARTGTSVTATHAATSSARAPTHSPGQMTELRRRAGIKRQQQRDRARRSREKTRTAGRSALAQSCEIVERLRLIEGFMREIIQFQMQARKTEESASAQRVSSERRIAALRNLRRLLAHGANRALHSQRYGNGFNNVAQHRLRSSPIFSAAKRGANWPPRDAKKPATASCLKSSGKQ